MMLRGKKSKNHHTETFLKFNVFVKTSHLCEHFIFNPLGTGGGDSGKTPERFLARNCITKFFVEKFDSHVNSLFLPTHWMAKKKFRPEREIAEI